MQNYIHGTLLQGLKQIYCLKMVLHFMKHIYKSQNSKTNELIGQIRQKWSTLPNEEALIGVVRQKFATKEEEKFVCKHVLSFLWGEYQGSTPLVDGHLFFFFVFEGYGPWRRNKRRPPTAPKCPSICSTSIKTSKDRKSKTERSASTARHKNIIAGVFSTTSLYTTFHYASV